MRRRCRAPTAAFALAAAIVFWPLPGASQTPVADPGAAAGSGNNLLLQPSLGGNPATRFRRPGLAPDDQPPPDKFVAPTRIGATPTYGSPNGFGAGNTGFDSLNTPRGKKKKKKTTPAPAAGSLLPPRPESTFAPVPTFDPAAASTPPAVVAPPPPEIYPKRAATRVGATLPPPPDELPVNNPPAEVHPASAANRAGAVVPIPPAAFFDYAATPAPTELPPGTLQLGTVPTRPLPIAGALNPYTVLGGVPALPLAQVDPYAALGIRAGSFLLFPSLDLSGGFTTNPERVQGGSASSYFVVAPELKVQSDWERHSFTADVVGSFTEYTQDLTPSLNVPFMNAKFDGRVDVTRDTQLLLEQRVIVATDNPGSPNLQTQLAKLPINIDVGDTVGIAQEFNRLAVSFRGTFDRAVYDPSQLTDGATASNSDRNFDQYAGILRAGYDLGGGLFPFVEAQGDERIHDEEFDRNGLQRDSVGAAVKVGSAVDLFGSLSGAMAVGYTERSYKDPTLPNVAGVIGDGALIWQPTGLTTAKLSATSQVYETILAGASGELSRDIDLQVDHAFRLWLIGTLKAGYGNDQYPGSTLTDNRYFVSLGLTYKLTPEVQMRGEVRQDWQIATQSGFNYTATSFLLGLRLQR